MSERGIHYVAADLDESWTFDWVGVGIVEIEAYLEKQAAFAAFLDRRARALPAEPGPARVEPPSRTGGELVVLGERALVPSGAAAQRDERHRVALDIGRLLAA